MSDDKEYDPELDFDLIYEGLEEIYGPFDSSITLEMQRAHNRTIDDTKKACGGELPTGLFVVSKICIVMSSANRRIDHTVIPSEER